MDEKQSKGLPSIAMSCPSCKSQFYAVYFSRAFSSGIEVICSLCGILSNISPYGEIAKYTGLYEDFNQASKYLKKCKCNGNFIPSGHRYDLYRCPKCKVLLPEDYILDCIGVDKKSWKSGAPFDGHVIVEGEDYYYTHPGLITVDQINDELWDKEIDEPGYQKAIQIDKESKNQWEQELRQIDSIRNEIKSGKLPEKIYFLADLDHCLWFKFKEQYCGIHLKDLNLDQSLIEKCISWQRFASYIEEGYCDLDYPPDYFNESSWDDYYKSAVELHSEIQTALGNRIKLVFGVERSGKPFHSN